MRISATGTWTSRPVRPVSGFTLIEILVVMVIIGVLVAGAALSVGVVGKDSAMDKERDRLAALFDYLRDQAALQNREFGMRCFIGGYEFMVFDARTAKWQRLQEDSITRTRRLPPGLSMQVRIEGRPIVLPRQDDGQDDEGAQSAQSPKRGRDEAAPQIMLFSSGDLNLFELTLRREATGEAVLFAPAKDSDRIEVTALSAAPA